MLKMHLHHLLLTTSKLSGKDASSFEPPLLLSDHLEGEAVKEVGVGISQASYGPPCLAMRMVTCHFPLLGGIL